MINFKESSTKSGLLLLGAGVAGLVTGNTELASIAISEGSTQMGGVVPMVASLAIGLWDTFRKEKK
ncbi:hypothetical protein A3K86_21905 [Photobacterium jeanii]|uniref:Holin n=1 Tax=Photobacterium jeanii TaxID=858640 RepID=A0A178K2P0_9GAMM|nr:hypothetical protein [Photobacterium jeanii]OAN11578.1 hypothetical protein A3K86_21905 [Photobacterium jeanii]PST91100.1 hypothetical protein C9I91_11010 [Photobacterium jeanii]